MAMPPSSSSALRLLLRTPTALRPSLLASPTLRANYHSHEHPTPPPYREPESLILSAALTHVPTHGFTPLALSHGARDVGYRDISTNLFPRGAFELVAYHLTTQRLALRQHPMHRDNPSSSASPSSPSDVPSRLRTLILARLHANSPVHAHWSQALGLMSLAENLSTSLGELGALSDELWYGAGDVAVDGSWYGKRAGLAGVYAATEMFQTTDHSEDFRETEEFLDRRLGEVAGLGRAVGDTVQWAGFQGSALVGLARSKGLRI